MARADDEGPEPRFREDLALAQACVRGDKAALERFERDLVPPVVAALRKVDPNPAFADDVLQRLRDKLLVAVGDEPPRLATYAGTGPLAGWLRVAALREAISQQRKTWRETPVDHQLLRLADPALSPEQDLAKRVHQDALRDALRSAFAAQPSRMRALFGFYYGDGIGVEELGRLYRVSPSTVSRWLSRTRDAILTATRKHLADQLRLGESEVDSMLGLAQSLDISLGALIKSNHSE